MCHRETDSQSRFKLLIFGSLIFTANCQLFKKHQQRKVLSTFSETQADSAIFCCSQCSSVARCTSASYNNETRACLLSEIKDTDISENTDIENGWTTFSMEWMTVFRAVAGKGMQFNSFLYGTPTASNEVSCKSREDMSCMFYRNPVLDNWSSIPHKMIKYALNKDGQEVAYFIFNGTGSEALDDWFKPAKFLESTWQSLNEDRIGNFDLHKVNRSGAHRYFMIRIIGGGCTNHNGYTVTVTNDTFSSTCQYMNQATNPQFLFSKTTTASIFESADMDKADDMTISVIP